MSILITRPRNDKGTHYLFHWSGLLIDEAKRNQLSIIQLDAEKATKKRFQSYLLKQPVWLIVANGHGDNDLITGHEQETLLTSKDGIELLKEKIIFARSCNSGSFLGLEAMKCGAKGFLGYNKPFMFAIDPDSFRKPLDDERAGPILECSNQVAISLIRGSSVTEAHESSLELYKEKIDEYSSSKFDRTWILPFLYWNRDCQVCYS
jgi:hypothetical protein